MLFRYKTNVYCLKFNRNFFLFCLFFLVVFCVLGVWQLHRFHERTALLASFEQKKQALPKPFSLLSGTLNDLQFQSVAIDGTYLNQLNMFIQNRMHQGQLGYDVLTPFRVSGDKRLVLIDRGWVPKTNSNLPILKPVKGEEQLTGYIKVNNEYQFTLGKNILEPITYPLVMQKIDINELSRITGYSFYPFIVRLDPANPHGFVRDWVITSVQPERHRMYAFQWFAFALIVLIAYLGINLQRVNLKND